MRTPRTKIPVEALAIMIICSRYVLSHPLPRHAFALTRSQMPIWSLTMERLEKLKNQIAAKKAEHDELEARSEKDLWCRDLDDLADEWETQLKLEEEIHTGIRRLGRRVSEKIGAGRGRKGKAADDDYQPEKKSRQPKAPKVEVKSQQRFMEKFQAKAKPKASSTLGGDGAADDFSDDDFALLGKKAVKQEVKEESEPPVSISEVTNPRSKRAAAAKSKYVLDEDTDMGSDDDFMELGRPAAAQETESVSASASASEVAAKPSKRAVASRPKSLYIDDMESESDDDNKLGDVGAMVKGIGGASSGNNGRLSLFAMSRPEAGDVTLPKLKTKASKVNLDFDSHDDTNYEALAMSSPRKSTKADEIDDFLSDDDLPPVSKAATAARATSSQAGPSKAKAPLSVASAAVKKRGRPAGAKNKTKDDVPAPAAKAPAAKKAPAKAAAAKPKPVHLSPAAKAYAAKQAKGRRVLSDDEDDDLADAPPSPVAKPKARPGRAAASKAKPIVIDDDDSMDLDGKDEDSEDAFAMDDSE